MNDYSYKDDPNKAEDSRYLHRGKMRWDLAEHADDPSTPEGAVFGGLGALTALRKANPAFGSKADVWTLDTGDNGLLAIGRYLEGQEIIGVFNFTGEDKRASLAPGGGKYADLLTGEARAIEDLFLPAYGFCYLERAQA